MEKKRLGLILLIILILLVIPLIAMQFTDEVNWTLTDFAVAGGLLFGTGLIFDFVSRKVKNVKYRASIFIALAILLSLIWAELAVGILGTPLSGR